jgi:hypothetical protein
MSHTAVLLREAIGGGLMGEALFWRGSKISGCLEFGCGFASNYVYVQGLVMVLGVGANGNESNNFIPSLPVFVNLTCMLQKSISLFKCYIMIADRRRAEFNPK